MSCAEAKSEDLNVASRSCALKLTVDAKICFDMLLPLVPDVG